MLVRSWIILFSIVLPILGNSQECPTWGQIYDYEIGDVFHCEKRIESGIQNIYWDIKKEVQVIDKFYSPEGDTVYYDLWIKELSRSDQSPEWSYTEYSDQEKYRSLELPIPCDTTYYSSLFNGRRTSHVYTQPYLSREDTEYVDGCGIVYNHLRMYYGKFWTFETSLVYFKKGQEEWGDPLNLTSITDYSSPHDQIAIFPNPANNKVSIELNGNLQISRLEVYDNLGSLLISKRSEFDQIDISTLPSGLYIVGIIGNDWKVNRKLIVQ